MVIVIIRRLEKDKEEPVNRVNDNGDDDHDDVSRYDDENHLTSATGISTFESEVKK